MERADPRVRCAPGKLSAPATTSVSASGVRLIAAALVILSSPLLSVLSATAGPITFNTGLAISKGEGIVRGQARVVRGSAGTMDQELTAIAAPAALAYGLTRDLALFAVLPLFVHKSLDLTTPMGRISRGSNGFGDVRFLARYTLLQLDHPGSTLRVAPFAGLQVPTGGHDRSDRFGTIPRPLQPGSGAWDPLGGTVLTYQTLDWEFDTDAGYKSNTTADQFSFGDEAFTDQSIQYRIWPRVLGPGVPGFLYAVLESNLIGTGKNRMHGRVDPDSGGLIWYLDPGVQYVTERYVLEAAVQLPAVTSLNGAGLGKNGLGNDFQLVAGFRWNFFVPDHF